MTTAEKEIEQEQVEIFTDGACCGNPGPGGWGAQIRFGKNVKEIWGGAKDTTNNRMELLAAIKGLQLLETIQAGRVSGGPVKGFEELKKSSKVRIFTDSQYLKNGITEWIHSWKVNHWKGANKKMVKNIDLWKKLDNIIANHNIEWEWIRGHSGTPGNERADQLAQRWIHEVES